MKHPSSLFILLFMAWVCFAFLEYEFSCEGPHVYRYEHPYEQIVGFNLNLGYGTASIYHQNRSFVNVAKIEGSPAYKHVMLDKESLGQRRSNASLLAEVPARLGGKQEDQIVAVQSMLQALKTAAEDYLGTAISDARVTLPFWTTHTFSDACFLASRNLGLYVEPLCPLCLPSGRPTLEGKVTAMTIYDIGGMYTRYSTELILVIDYSRAGIVATLLSDEDGHVDTERILLDPAAGTDAIEDQPILGYKSLVENIQEVTQVPVPIWGGSDFVDEIHEVILVGEAAQDPLLVAALKTVFGEDLSRKLAFNARMNKKMGIDPVYAASLAAAKLSAQEIKYGFYPNYGC